MKENSFKHVTIQADISESIFNPIVHEQPTFLRDAFRNEESSLNTMQPTGLKQPRREILPKFAAAIPSDLPPQNHLSIKQVVLKTSSPSILKYSEADIKKDVKLELAPQIDTPSLDENAPLTYDIEWMRRNKAMPGIFQRELLGMVLQYEGLKTGVELGVQLGNFSEVCFPISNCC